MYLSSFHSAARQRGFSMPIAVFILVIMTLLGTAMIQLVSTSHMSIANETLSTRAFYAAESGAQYGMNLLFPLDGTLPGCFADTTLNFNVNGLNGCSATTVCNFDGDFNGNAHYTIASTGQCDNAIRQIQVGAKQ